MNRFLVKLGCFVVLLLVFASGLKAESEHPNAETKLIQPSCTPNRQCGDCLCVNGFCDCKSDFKRKGMNYSWICIVSMIPIAMAAPAAGSVA
ncbi:uncharacterized protein DS421_4g115410 [Arachis hypogaea]|nr:uncharacterized protein DS421_4g115410 [Arachis hypogaea]